MEPVTVLEHLCIGNLSNVCDAMCLKKHHIQSIMTVDVKPLSVESCLYKQIPILDLANEDLITHLEDALKWIDQSRLNNKTAIVHCNAGQSRSAAVVIAYLMWKLRMGYEDSFRYLKKLKPDIMPNEGFVEQLKLFEFMDCQVDRKCKAYSRYQLERIGQVMANGHMIREDVQTSLQDVASTTEEGFSYKCKKCRKLLFTEGNLISHDRGIGQSAFSKPWDKQVTTFETECKSSIFIEPMKWMERLELHELTGKINCVKCSAKIGSWSWAGERCSCGTWVTPAFHMDSKKIDRAVIVAARPSPSISNS
ncbi:DUSP12 [Bugula neritina]|uniref:protein-tyrosine-phosphatase n=1 Tax=Bugula neritina TaxID=10212 RepID=A0A7J7JGC5_BUGNE|nr:DUSP12 [Bugula neritina]